MARCVGGFWLCSASVSAPLASAQLVPAGPVDFGSVPVNTPTTQTISFVATTLTTIGAISVVTNGSYNLDYIITSNTCTGSIIPPNSCAVTIAFTPSQIGERNGALLFTDITHSDVTKTFLHGVGTGSSFAMAPVTATVLSSATGITPATFTSSASVVDGNGNLYFTDPQNSRVLEMSTTGTVTIAATLPVTNSSSLAIAGDGTVYVSTPNLVFAFTASSPPTAISTGSITLLNATGLAIDGYGALFIADTQANQIYRYSLTGSGTNAVTITGISALSAPTGLTVDDSQNLYISDTGNNRIVEINPDTPAITPASVVSVPGFTLSNAQGLAMDPAGTLYIADTGNARIVEVTAQGVTFALADAGLTLTTPTGILVNDNGDLVIEDNALGLVTVPRSAPSITFPTSTIVGTQDTTDDPITLTVQSTGNIVAELFIPSSGPDPYITTTAFLFGSGATCPTVASGSSTVNLFSLGEICTYRVDFQPTQVGLNTANLVFETSAQGATTPSYTQTVPLAGNGISGAVGFTLVASPSTNTVGGSDSLVLTAVQAGGATATYYTGTITFTTTDATGVFLGGATYQLTAADNGVLSIPAATGIQFNHTGYFTVSATDGTFSATSNVVHIVNASTMTLTSSINPSNINQSTNFVATITNAGPAATGTVSFFSNGTLIGTGTLVNGVATLPYAYLICGDYAITATYPGDSTTQSASAGPLTQDVLCAVSLASQLTSSLNPSDINQAVTFTASLYGINGPVPTGTVTFYSNGVQIGATAITLANGIATLPDTFTAAGTYPITAVYSGDAFYAGITLGPLQQVVYNTSTLTLTSSQDPSLPDNQVTFTATITTSGVQATGSVSFSSNGTIFGNATLVNGAVSIPYIFTVCGSYAIIANYFGDANTATATAEIIQTVSCPVSTSSTLTSVPNPSTVGQSVTFTATLVGNAGPVPTGTVTFFSNGIAIPTCGNLPLGIQLGKDVATCPYTFTAAGTYPITAIYSGDLVYSATTLGPLQQVVINTSAMTLASSANPSQPGQPVTFSAAIITSGLAATGSVSFFVNGTLLGSSALNASGVATLPDSFPICGVYAITATYPGDTQTEAASAALSQTVSCPISTSSTLISSQNPTTVNTTVTFTATLSSNGGPIPTGTVTFYSNGVQIGQPITLANFNATSSDATSSGISYPTIGTYPITAVYSGDAFNSGITLTLQEVVDDTSSMTLISSKNPSPVGFGVLFTATVTSTGPTPTGTITFTNNGSVLCSAVPMTGGVAQCNYTFNVAGHYPVLATYSGDSNTASATASLIQIVGSTLTATLSSSSNPATFTNPVTFTATLTGYTSPLPTGTVTFIVDGTAQAPVAVSATTPDIASLILSTLSVGSHTISCVYNGDTNYLATPCSPALSESIVNPTTSVLIANPSPVQLGNMTTLAAAVTSAGGNIPSGTVNFTDGGTFIGSGQLNASGIATLPFTFSTAGAHSLSCNYLGDTNDAPSTCNVVAFDVDQATALTLSDAPNPSVVNKAVTFNTVLSSPNTTQPFSGSITISTGGTTLCTASATVPCTYAFPTSGTYPIVASYSGDTYHAAATSNTVLQVVLNSATIVLTSSVNPILVNNSSVLTVVATSTGTAPTGTISFYDGNAPIGNATLVAGTASLTASFPGSGTHSLTAVYGGDPANAPASSNLVSETVADYSLSAAMGTSSTASVAAGGTASFGLMLTPLVATTLPTAVSFSIDGLPTGMTAVFSPTSVAAGSGATPLSLALTAPAITARSIGSPARPHHRNLAPAVFALLLLPLALVRKRRKLGPVLLLLLMAFGLSGLTGCITDASTGYYGQTAQTYSLTVSANSGSLSRTTIVTVTVQ